MSCEELKQIYGENSTQYRQCINNTEALKNAEFTEEEQGILDNYNAISLSDEDQQDIIDDLKKSKEKIFKEARYYKPFGIPSRGYQPSLKSRSESQLKKFFESSDLTYEDYLKYQDDGTIPNPTEEDILKEQNIRIENKQRDFLENVDNSSREIISQKQKAQQKIFEEQQLKLEKEKNNIADVDEKGKLVGGEVFEIDKKLKNMQGFIGNQFDSNKVEPTAVFYENFNSLVKQRNVLVNEYEKISNKQILDLDENASAKQAIDVWQRSYSNADQLIQAGKEALNNIKLAGIELGELITQAYRGVPGIVEYSTRSINPDAKSSSGAVNWLRSQRNQTLDTAEYLNNIRETKLPKTIKLENINNTDDFINYSLDAVMNNIPNSAMAFAGPGVATAWFTLSGLGDKSSDFGLEERKIQTLKEKIQKESDPFEKMYLEKELEAYNDAINTNQITKFLAAVVHGAAESIPARMFGTIKIAQGIKDVYRYIPKQQFKKAGFAVANAFGKTPVLESVEEGFTNTLQNLNDIYVLNKDISIFDNLDESMVQGLIIGNGFSLMQSAPNVYGALLNVAQTRQNKKEIRAKVNELNTILEDYQTVTSPDGRKELRLQGNRLVKEIVSDTNITLEKLTKLDYNQLITLGNLDRQLRAINKQYIKAVNSGISDSSLKIIKNNLKTEFDNIQNQKAEILGKQTRTDQKLENLDYASSLVKGKQILGENLVIIDDNTDIDKLGITKEQADSPGFVNEIDGKVYINEKIALDEGGNINVIAHEILHKVLTDYVSTDQGEQAIIDFYNNLDEETKAAIDNELKSRDYIDENTQDVIQGLKSKNVRIDEILTQYLDLVENTDNNIDINEGTLSKIKDFIAKFLQDLGFKGKFSTAGDVKRFLVDYRKKFKSGDLQVKGNKSGEAFSRSVKKGDINTLATDMASKGYDNLTQAEQTSLKNQYTSVALAAIKFDAGKGTVNTQDAQSFVDSQFATIARNYRPRDPRTNKKQDFTTYIYNTVGRRGADLYGKQEALAEAGQTTSLDDERARQIADPGLDTETTSKQDVTPTIEVFDFIKKSDPSFDSKKFEKDFTDGVNALAAEKNIDLSNPDLTPKQRMDVVPYKVLADAIGIPVNKITNPKANLSTAEARKAQKILSAAKPFIKNVVLTKANTDVTSVESKTKRGKSVKIGGETLGLGTKILNTFFNPPKRLGSGKKVRTPKQFDNKLFNEAIGIKNGKVSPDFNVRNSQIIKGLLKAVAEQMSGRATSRTLDAGPQAQEVKLTQAQLDSMKSPLVFSKARSNIKTKIPKFKKDAKGKKQYKDFLQQKLFPLFPKSFFLQGGDSALQFLESKGQYFSKTEIDNIIKEQGNNFGKPFPKGVNLKYINKRYNQVFPQGWDSMVEMHNSGELAKMNDSNALLGKAMWDRIYKSIRNAVNSGDQNFLQGLQTYMAGVGSIDNHPLKMIAPVVGGTFGYQKGKENVTYEHARPASDTYNLLINAAIGYKSKQSFDKVYAEAIKNYKVIALAEVDGAKVDKFYKTKMPDGVTEWFRRYANPKVATENGGIDVNNLYLFSQGKVFSDAFGIDSAGKPLTNEGKVIAKAATKKYQTLDNGIVFSKSVKGKKAIEKRKQNEPKDLSKDFNSIIQENKGIKAEAVYSEIVARRQGRDKGRFKFFLPPGAEDFKGLIYTFLGKGKKGEKQFEFFDNNLIKPYLQGVSQIETFRRTLKADYTALLKLNPEAAGKLNTKIANTEYSFDQAVRAYLMNESGYNLKEAGLSARDAKLLIDAVKNDPTMVSFAQGLQLITKQDTWLSPNGGFDVQTIQSDLHRLTQGAGRKKFFENSGFIPNSEQIFNRDNLNKVEAAYGYNVKEAIQDILYRMKNGTNRPSGSSRLTNSFNNWVNRSIGAIMFFNRKSALLQTISSINFINWSDNNPLKAAIAFGNQPQYWKDFATIFNSDKLKERRAGLKGDINEAELASAVKNATNKAEAALSWLLKKGFLPTQMADSFAIASGGATFYRNRINTYKKQGLSDVEAEKKAFEDFSRISEESQQSADPSMISPQQASPLGRLILAFQNTPMQYTRLMKRAAQDLIAGRGDAKTHISKIIYYGAVQNFMFSALQNALFALIPGFSEENPEEEETDKEKAAQIKNVRIINNMVDTILRGSGVYGAIAATAKNTIVKYYQNEQKDPFAKDNADIIIEAINLSPPIGSKVRKLNNALRAKEFEKDVIEERGWEITRDGRVNLSPSYRVIGSAAEALLNIPLERTIAEIDALTEVTDSRNSNMQRIALALGWRTWDLGVRNEESDQIKLEAKERRKTERAEETKRKREEKKRLEEEKKFEGLSDAQINALKRRDQIEKLTKAQQVDSLIKLGLSKKDIRALRLEEDRINKIIELNK